MLFGDLSQIIVESKNCGSLSFLGIFVVKYWNHVDFSPFIAVF